MEELILKIYTFLWGPFTIVLILALGIFLTLRLNFIQIRFFLPSIQYVFQQLFRKKDRMKEGISPFQALSTALAGTIGVGSLAGVSTAIVMGGPGAIFWMWVCAFFGMAIKFCEIFLSKLYQHKSPSNGLVGGPMYYIRDGIKSQFFAKIFALSCVFSCFGMGNAVQSNALATALSKSFQIPAIFTGLILAFISALVIFGGIKNIGKLNEKIVPLMALFYFTCCVIVVLMNIKNLPHAFSLIINNVFGAKQVSGGFVGYSIFRSLSSGISKGIFISEAGLGSGSIAHGATTEEDPIKEGYFGIIEVFVTVFLISTLTALVILSSGIWSEGASGIALTIKAFDLAVPNLGKICITVSTVFFSLSTILGWAYYGEVCLDFITKRVNKHFFRFAYILVIFLSSFLKNENVWLVSEIFNGLMAYPNLIALFLLSGIVAKKTNKKRIGAN